MRTLFASALVLVLSACADRPERADGSGALASIPAGQDPVVLRVPVGGGLVSAERYPGLDSVVWRATHRVPALARVLGHDPEDGYLVAVDTAGRPVRIDLRLGTAATPGVAGSALHTSGDGATVFAIAPDGAIARYTPFDDGWRLARPVPPVALVPLRDGSLLLLERDGDAAMLRRVRPPDTLVVDSLRLALALDGNAPVTGVAVGDRVFLAAGESVVSLRTRDFVQDVAIDVGSPVHAMATSPSGDRLFVLAGERDEVRVIDRFTGNTVARVDLPAAGDRLRPDPLGRVLLVGGADDVVWVVDVGTASLTGALRSTWRGDLPLVLPDGAVALAHGDTVALASSIDLGVVRTLPDGARDFWYAMRWNGFRPRAAGLDEPVNFRISDERARSEGAPTLGAAASGVDSSGRDSPVTVADTVPPPTTETPARSAGFTVQFAAVLTEALARTAAAEVTVEGRSPRITTSVRDGRTVYRVVLGPFPTREEAERIGRASGRSYWVFEGAP
jgi:hypothetical protein